MYLSDQKLYALGGESIIQHFPDENNQKKQQQLGTSSLDLTDSLYVSNLNQRKEPQNQKGYGQQQREEPYIPRDLGRDYYDFLQNEYYKKNGIRTTDASSLFSLWQIMKRREMNDTNKKQEHFLRNQQKLEESNKQMSIEAQQRLTGTATGFKMKSNSTVDQDKASKLRAILSSNKEDIHYTLQVHEEEAIEDNNIGKYLENRSEKLEQEMRSKKSKKKMSKDVENRLIGKQQKPIQEEKVDPSEQFVQRIFDWRQRNYPKAGQDYKTAEKTKKLWDLIENKAEDPVLNKNPDKAQQLIDQYYERKMKKIDELYQKKLGKKPERITKNEQGEYEKVGKKGGIVWFWNNQLSVDDKKRHDVNFESQDNLESNAQWFQERQEREENKRREERKHQQQQKDARKKQKIEQSQMSELEKSKTKSQLQEEKLEKLSKPKDRLRLGKQLLKLKSMFPCDKTLQKMIYHEFTGTRLAKYANEYDVFDSDEEDLRKGCYEKDPKKENGFLVYEDLDRPQKEREKQMSQFFKKELDEYKQKNKEMTKSSLDKEKQERKENQEVDRFMSAIAANFIELRKHRLEQQIPGLHEYLATQYQNLRQECPSGAKRLYPAYAWNQKPKKPEKQEEQQQQQKEVKQDKQEEHLDNQDNQRLVYPVAFKRDFFIRVKEIVKSQSQKQNSKIKKLAFWCPVSSGDGKCRIHISRDCPPDCKYQSLNRRVMELSRFTTNAINQQKQIERAKAKGMNQSVWSQREYFKERMTIMMTYSDAQECTFQPQIVHTDYSKNQEKEANDLKSWVDKKFGENFEKFPIYYKEGNFKRAVLLWQQGKFILAYRKLMENFNIPLIKKQFDSNYFPYSNPNSMYCYRNLKVDEEELSKKSGENFVGKKSNKLMKDVYQLITYLEEADKDILRAKREINKKLKDNTRSAVFQQATALYERQDYQRAYKKIQYNFNITSIRQHFEKETGSSNGFKSQGLRPELKKKLNLNYQKIENLPEENFNNPKTNRLYRNIYRLNSLLEDQMNNPQQKHHDFVYDHEQEDVNLDYNERKLTAKSYMCPLGSACPADLRPRWPHSDQKTIYPFGSKCPFAHHTFELKFQFIQINHQYNYKRTELKQKNKMMKDMLSSITNRLGADPVPAKWNCGGSKFTECIGCGAQIGKRWAKGICATCSLRKDSLLKLIEYSAAAKKKYKEITAQKQFASKQQKRLTNEQNLNKKIGYLQQANILHNKQRHSEAFKVIIKAVEIVKHELADYEKEQRRQQNELKKTLKIDEGLLITKEMAYLPPSQSDKNATMQQGQIQYQSLAAAGGPDAPFQTIRLFAEKAGIIGDQPINVNDFVNHQIELLYKKIDAALGHSVKDITLMKKRIDKLEGTEELDQQPISEDSDDEGKRKANYHRQKKIIGTKKEMCKELMETGICKHFNDPNQPCPFAHFAYELDLVETDSKVQNLQSAIRNVEERLLQSLPPKTWNPTSKKDAIKPIQEFDEQEDLERLTKGKPTKKRIELAKTIYSQDLSELTRPPNERISRNDDF